MQGDCVDHGMSSGVEGATIIGWDIWRGNQWVDNLQALTPVKQPQRLLPCPSSVYLNIGRWTMIVVRYIVTHTIALGD
jgi:hypothetical protein